MKDSNIIKGNHVIFRHEKFFFLENWKITLYFERKNSLQNLSFFAKNMETNIYVNKIKTNSKHRQTVSEYQK